MWHRGHVLFILISMLVIVVVAGLVVTFVAFPHRGEDIPGAAWLGDGMAKAVDALPTLEPESYDDADDRVAHARSLVGDDESDRSH